MPRSPGGRTRAFRPLADCGCAPVAAPHARVQPSGRNAAVASWTHRGIPPARRRRRPGRGSAHPCPAERAKCRGCPAGAPGCFARSSATRAACSAGDRLEARGDPGRPTRASRRSPSTPPTARFWPAPRERAKCRRRSAVEAGYFARSRVERGTRGERARTRPHERAKCRGAHGGHSGISPVRGEVGKGEGARSPGRYAMSPAVMASASMRSGSGPSSTRRRTLVVQRITTKATATDAPAKT